MGICFGVIKILYFHLVKSCTQGSSSSVENIFDIKSCGHVFNDTRWKPSSTVAQIFPQQNNNTPYLCVSPNTALYGYSRHISCKCQLCFSEKFFTNQLKIQYGSAQETFSRIISNTSHDYTGARFHCLLSQIW